MAREIQPAADAGSRTAVRGLSRRAPRAGFPRRPGHSRHPGARRPHELCSAHRTGVCARREDQRARGLRPLLHGDRRTVGGDHERQPALRIRLRQLCAAAVCHAVHHGGQRPGRGTALSRTDPDHRRLGEESERLRRLVAVHAHHRCSVVLPSKRDAVQRELHVVGRAGSGPRHRAARQLHRHPGASPAGADRGEPREPGALPEPEPAGERDARYGNLRPVRRERHLHHALRPVDSRHPRTVRRQLRRHHVSKDHRQLQLQRARGVAAPCRTVAGIAGGLHVRKIARSVIQPVRGRQPAQSEPEQGALGVRYAPQLRGQLRLETSARQTPRPAQRLW